MGGLNLIFSEEDIAKFHSVFSEEEYYEPNKEILDKEFVGPDGKMKLSYSSDWEKVSDENFLSNVFSEKTTEEYNLKILFFAHYLKSKIFSQLYVAEGYLGNETSSEEIINLFKRSGEEENFNVTIINQELEGNRFIFEFVCEKENYPSYRFKELIIISEEKESKSYFITFAGPEKDWPKIKDRADNILNSVEIID